MFRLVWLSLLVFLIAACSSTGVPRVTPTVAPTDTPEQGTPIVQEPSRTPVITLTTMFAPSATSTPDSSDTPQATETEIPSDTPAPTDTPTQTATRRPTALPVLGEPTNTPTDVPTETPIPTDTPSPTRTYTDAPTATETRTPSPRPTNTPNPIMTETPLPTSTDTQTPALPPTLNVEQIRATVSARQTANALTSTPTLNANQIAEAVFATQTAFPPTATARAEQTAIQLTAQITVTPPPTLDTTPTFITATPGIPPFTLTPIPQDVGIIPPQQVGDSTVDEFGNTLTPAPTATFIFPTVPPVLAPPTLASNWQEQITGREFTNTGTQNYTVGAVVPVLQGSVGYSIGTNGDILPEIFVRNPVNANSYVRTNSNGTLYINNGGQEYIPSEPFSPYVGSVSSPAQNDYFVSAVAWSGDGRYAAFVVDGDRGGHPNPTGEDGVHYLDLETGAVVTVVRDCPYDGHPGCLLGGARDFHAQTTDVVWSPGSTRMIVRQRITEGWALASGRGALLIVPLDQPSDRQPVTLRYDYGAWTNDGRRVVVSGQSPNNGVIIGTVNTDNSDLQVILDGSARGLWIQNAVQRPDGSFVALGRPAGESAVRIIDQNGNFLTAPIGTAAPQSVTWNTNRSAVSVIAGGRQYIAYLDGRVNEVVLGSEVPGGSAPAPIVPSGVVEGNRFGPGDQAQVQSEQLNIRTGPGLSASLAGVYLQRGEYVRVLAGPVSVDGYEWWQVTTADGRLGWVAGTIGGFVSLAYAP